MPEELSCKRLHRSVSTVSTIALFSLVVVFGVVKVGEPSDDSIQPTADEKQALVAAKKLGWQFRVDENNAPIYGYVGTAKVTDAGLKQLGRLKSLQILYLNRSNISDAGLKHLIGLTKLRKLYLGEAKVSDVGLTGFKGLTSLEYLHLGTTKVTGAGLEHLQGLANLRILHLFNTQVTDDGLTHLRGLSTLQALSLGETDVTDEGVNKLQQSLPKCVICGKPEWAIENPDDAKQLSVSIAVPERESKRTIDIRKPGSHFDVVVTNLSKRELRLWETWNSWGYYNLSFECLDEKGNVVNSISKKPTNWTRNAATWVTLKPGEHFVLKVDFDPDIWIWGTDIGSNQPVYIPFLALANTTPEFNSRLRAVFRILPDGETIDHDVWTGTVKSVSDTFVIRHTPRKVTNGSKTSARDPRLTDAKAIEIATLALSKKFPASFEKCKPYRAKLAMGIWHVYGTVPGGAPEAHVRDRDGAVVRAFHSQ